MPFKHATETLLLCVVALVTALTGLLLPSLPLLPGGLLPWSVLVLVLCAYPLLLGPAFRANRAPKTLRLLHWYPALLALIWGLLALLAWFIPRAGMALRAFEFGWSLPGVAVGIGLICAYAFQVLRWWQRRAALFSSLLTVFAICAFLGNAAGVPDKLRARLFSGHWWELPILAQLPSSSHDGANLSTSPDPDEEAYRSQMRDVESSRPPVSSSSAMSQQQVSIGQTSSKPSHLPGAGIGIEPLMIAMLAGYTTVLQRRRLCGN